jgi:predicted helicase
MYARFFRWASDRLASDGVLAFITNRSFIDSRTFDGFRKTVAQEFSEAYVVDLGGDVRANPKLSGTKHNVFGIQTGVAISFFVKRHGAAGKKGARVFYARRPEMETAEEKIARLGSARASALEFDEVRPDAKGNWLNLTSNDFDELLPIASKSAKSGVGAAQAKCVFKLFSLGVVTARDEWVYDAAPEPLQQKVCHFIDSYEQERNRWNASRGLAATKDFVSRDIKWTSELESHLARNHGLAWNPERLRVASYRPYCSAWTYYDAIITHRLYQQDSIFPVTGSWRNRAIVYTQAGSQKPFCVLAVDRLPDLHLVGAAAGTECMPLYRYDDGQCIENITDWSLTQFKKHYQPGGSKKAKPITKEAIFHYVYAVLHDPKYREKYAQNLKREFPRIPFYGDSEATFWLWTDWGERLMALHIGYEAVEPFALKRSDVPDDKASAAGQPPKPALKADKDAGTITLDSETTLAGVPPEAWRYQLGNRCAIDWVLDQHKEKKPKDPTIRAKFDTYRFADHKEKVIDLLARVTTVSVETMRIVDAMLEAKR